MKTSPPTAFRHAAELDALQSRFAYRVTARLDEQAEAASHDVGERLRVAREQAMARARLARAASAKVESATATVVSVSGGAATLSLGGGGPRFSGWWLKLAGVLPLIALVGGLVLIQDANTRAQIDAAAEIDSALLSDDLPPDAYSDPGFAEFLKAPGS